MSTTLPTFGRTGAPRRTLALATTLALALSGCSLMGGDEASEPDDTAAQEPTGDAQEDDSAQATEGADDAAATTGAGEEAQATTEAAPPREDGSVVLLTHGSFSVPDELVAAFEAETGLTLEIQESGDAGQLANQIVLTDGRPTADVVFGLDNTFASRVLEAEVLEGYESPELPESAAEHALGDGGDAYLTPVDYGDVCVNIDHVWFANQGIEPPSSFEDLTDETYADLFVTPGAATSSPGMAFLLATIGHFGPGEWQPYWEDLMDNGAKVTSGWTDAYTVDFTAGGGEGDRPIVLSYASSPPATIPEGGFEPTTSVLLDTCFRQTEYAGVLAGAENPEGAREVIDWLLSAEVQASVPENMYMYPVDDEVILPETWAQWATTTDDPIVVHPQQIEAERETWLREWADIATR